MGLRGGFLLFFFAAAMEFSYRFNYVVQASIYQDFFFQKH